MAFSSITRRAPSRASSAWPKSHRSRTSTKPSSIPKSHYFDEKSKRESPRWWHVDVKVLKQTRLLSLPEMRATPALAAMRVLQRGNRLSITPVSDDEWREIERLLATSRPAA